MRIAINAAFLDARAAGLVTYARAVIEDLTSSPDEVFVYSSARTEVGGNGLAKWRRTPSSLRAESGTLGNILRATLWSQTALPFRVLRDRAQVLLCTVPEGMLVPVCPQVVVVHDIFPLFFPELYPRWKHYFRQVLPRILRASAAVVAVSNHTREDLVRHLGVAEEKITVVYNWIDPVFFSDDPGVPAEDSDGKPYFLYIGRSSPHKNLEAVIRAFARVFDKVPHRLICVLGYSSDGDREYCQQMLNLAADLGVRDRLVVHSGLARSQVLFLYRHATALVLLSKYEGFGYPPLEAMATGTPAIVSDSTSLAEVAGPGAVCVPNTGPEPAAEAMKKLACDAAYRTELSEAGKKHARQFTRERSGRMIRSILERCAGLSVEGAA